MNRPLIAGLLVGGVLLAAGCGGNDEPEQTQRSELQAPTVTTDVEPDDMGPDDMGPGMESDMGPGMGGPDGNRGGTQDESGSGAYDPQKVAAFVSAFRSAYPELSADRPDDDIAEIATESCDDMAGNMDRQQVQNSLADRAENDGRAPTPEQAQQIYDLVVPVCS